MGELVVVEGERFTPKWGLAPGPWLWGARLRILVVTDGRIKTDSDPLGFGLGPVLETLRDQFAWWVRIEVDVARRDGSPGYGLLDDPIRYRGFRFTQPGFDIDSYDQVWFFGDHPGETSDETVDDGVVDDPEFSPMSDEELRVVAEWMDRGGGVFATGDHGLLGASMCSRVPRVGTMRKWTHAQGVPPRDGPDRHETYFAVWPTDPWSWESDNLPQPIRPVLSSTSIGPAFGGLHPHPLLCSAAGPIDVLPDHMHEGEVVADDDVDLGRTVAFAGYQRAEYPSQPPLRSRPRVIAHGSTTNPDAPAREFGLISVYDGEPVGCGRVVVDSTWHHWLSMNLLGLRQHNPTAYQKVQAYHRNVALWLATPEQRASMLFAAAFGGIAGSPPMAFQRGTGPWEIGRQVLDVIGRTAPQCFVDEMVGVFVGRSVDRRRDAAPDTPVVAPAWSVLPSDLVARAIVGGVGASLLDLVSEQRVARAAGRRPGIDPDAIRRHGIEGAMLGRSLLVEALDELDEVTAGLRRHLGADSTGLDAGRIPVPDQEVSVRVVVEHAAFRDGGSPARPGDAIVLRARVGDVVVGEVAADLDGLEAGGEAAAEWVAVELVVQRGEELTVEVLLGPVSRISPPRVAFREVLRGEPSGWAGWRRADGPQPWVLWYRVEELTGSGD